MSVEKKLEACISDAENLAWFQDVFLEFLITQKLTDKFEKYLDAANENIGHPWDGDSYTMLDPDELDDVEDFDVDDDDNYADHEDDD